MATNIWQSSEEYDKNMKLIKFVDTACSATQMMQKF